MQKIIHIQLESPQKKTKRKKKIKKIWTIISSSLSKPLFFSLAFSLDQARIGPPSRWFSLALSRFLSLLVKTINQKVMGLGCGSVSIKMSWWCVCWDWVCKFRSRWDGGAFVGFGFAGSDQDKVMARLLGLGLGLQARGSQICFLLGLGL